MRKAKQPPVPRESEISQLPQWEKELRLLFSLSHVLMPAITAPTGIVDTSGRCDPSLRDRAVETSERRFIDPTTVQIHPYVRQKYLADQIAAWASAQPPPRAEGTSRLSRVYPAMLISAEAFAAGGVLAWPYESADHLIADVAEVIEGQLRDWRAHPNAFEKSIPQTAAIRLSPLLRAQLARLAGLVVDVPLIYSTIYFSGTALLQAIAFYEELERRRRALRREIRKDKQSLRLHLRAWTPLRCDPDTFEHLQRHKGEIFHSLDLIYQPTEEAVRTYRRKFGISLRKEQPAFWSPLIRWTVKRLDRAGVTRMRAFRAVATLLHELWPTIHRTNVKFVKARFYHSR